MGDIKLFRITSQTVDEIEGSTDTVEKSVQNLFEKNLLDLLGVRFLESEYVTTNGRIDTLGIDENSTPVIIEYKRSMNENVINQGLFYLDWLMDHRKDFQWVVLKKLGQSEADKVDWSSPRLICIAGDFNKYDDHAIRQMQRNIELIRYRRFGDDLLMLDLVAATSTRPYANVSSTQDSKDNLQSTPRYKRISDIISELDSDMLDRFEEIRAYLRGMGSDVQEAMQLYYIAFRRIKNFACVEVRPRERKILLYLKVDPKSVLLGQGFARDVSKIGHYGTGDLELTIRSRDDFERAKPMIEQSYAIS